MARLLLRDEATREAWRVWPEPEVLPAGRIQEAGTYLFELHECPGGGDAILLVDDAALEGLRPSDGAIARWRWAPGFHAGAVEVELRVSGAAPQQFEVVTDPDRRKLTRDDFDLMVREILDDSFALFALSGFRKGVAHGIGNRPPPLARLEFLRSRIAELEAVVARIGSAPRRVLAATNVPLPYHRAAGATGPEILRSLRSGRIVCETHAGPTRLPPALKGFLPARIHVRERRTSLDVPEHRQMGACLRAWADWLAQAADLLCRAGGDDTELRSAQAGWATRCRRLSHRVAALAAASPFAEAADAPARLLLSSLFRRDAAYGHFFRLYQDMNRGIAAVFGDFLQMPLARTFELYELWCFLRLVRAGAETYGPAGLSVSDLFITDASGGVTLRRDAVTVPVGSGWQLCFQKQYQEFWKAADGRGSYSRAMVPDIVVAGGGDESSGPGRLIVLDAKYRVNDGLGDALSSIHTYRDALVREPEAGRIAGIVSAAYLVAPVLPDVRSSYRDTGMPGRLFHPEYRRSFRFGAVTLRPGMTVADVAAVLQSVVDDALAA